MRFCGACGAPLAELPDGMPSGGDAAQRRHVTVVFCDVVDSTPLAERLDPEDLREVMQGYQDACVRSIERYGGFVAQYAGDGLVAYFGYPRAHEHDAQRAVHAALELLEEIVVLNGRLGAEIGVSLAVRVGVHTGLVVAGQMGAGQARELAMVGDAPYIAARVQAVAAPGSVLVTETTRELIGDRFELQALGARSLKGVSRAIDVHRVLSAAPGKLPVNLSAAKRREPMIDRIAARAHLSDAWQAARAGRGVVVHISGEAGIGKSRLVRALREEIVGQTFDQHVLQCSPHHSTTALHPVIRFLEQSLELDRSLATSELLREIGRPLLRAGLDPAEGVPLLADLLSLANIDAAVPPLRPREARNATLRILEELLIGTPAEEPLLLVVEDLQWADPTTIALLERIAAHLVGRPVACVLTFRVGYEPPWHGEVEVDLGPLAPEDVRALAAAVSPSTLAPHELMRVQSAADGIPLFAEELVKLLAAVPEPGASSPTPERAVPPTLQNLLAERLDRLPELTELIDLAAVLGREFERDLLAELSPLGGARFTAALDQLIAEDVVRPVERSRSRSTLEFKHALLQEAAYERLLRDSRRRLHARVAELLLARRARSEEHELEVIAHHLSSADQPALALTYWRLAGSRALNRAAFQEAAAHFRRALASLDAVRPDADGDDERGALLLHLGAALQAGRGYAADGVELAYTRASRVHQRAGKPGRLLPAIRGLCMFHLLRAEFAPVLELADEMLALGADEQQRGDLADGHLYRGLAHMYMAEPARAREHLEASLAHYERPDAPDEIYEAQGDTGVGALAYLAPVLWGQGHVHEAFSRSEESLRLAEQIDGPMTLAQAWGMRGGLLMLSGNHDDGGEWLERTRIHSEERNIVYWRTVCSLWSEWMHGRAGDPALGAERLREQLDGYRAAGARLGLPQLQILLADLRLAAGDRAGALHALDEGVEHIETTGERYSEPELNWLLARTLMAGETPDPPSASAAYERALSAVAAQGAKLLELRAASYLAVHQREIGESCTALARVASLCEWFPADLQVPELLRARALLRHEPASR
jgi:class 3 adenylate cyclase/tetratricopeptide (TPR) repeat protein